MPLKVILVDKENLISHGNWDKYLNKLLTKELPKDVAVVDIQTFEQRLDKEAEFENGLFIADCEATVQQAKEWNMAVLGYEPVRNKERLIFSYPDIIVEGFEEVDFSFLERVYLRFHHLPWTILETRRCVLREMTLGDLEDLYELYRPEEITRYTKGLNVNFKEEETFTKAYIENMYRFYGYGLWVVIEKETGQLIGRAGLSHSDTEEETCIQLGYVIAKEKQNQGYATEVCREILNYVGKELDFPAICCLIQKENSVSIHLAEKLGFGFEKDIVWGEKTLKKYMMIINRHA